MDSRIRIARIGGFLYLLIVVFGLIAQVFVRDSLVDYGDAAVTAQNILASESWYRFGFVSELFMLVCDIGVTTILFILLREVNFNVNLLSTFFRLASIIILCVTALSHYAALSFLGQPEYLSAFSPAQLDAMALLSVRLHGSGYNISLLFFGFHLVVLGYLFHRSSLIPGFLGVLLVIGGVSYIVNSLTWFLLPDLVKVIYPAIMLPCAIGEWLLCIWLIIKGVKLKTPEIGAVG